MPRPRTPGVRAALPLVLPLVLPLLLVTACGTSKVAVKADQNTPPKGDQTAAIQQVVRSADLALATGDGATFCDNLTAQAQVAVISYLGNATHHAITSCPDFVTMVHSIQTKDDIAKLTDEAEKLVVTKVTVTGSTATIQASDVTVPAEDEDPSEAADMKPLTLAYENGAWRLDFTEDTFKDDSSDSTSTTTT